MDTTFSAACKRHGGSPSATRRAFYFPAATVTPLLADLGFDATLPAIFADREIAIEHTRNGHIVISTPQQERDSPPAQWRDDCKGRWQHVIGHFRDKVEAPLCEMDILLRCLSASGHPAGWAARLADGRWCRKTAGSTKTILQNIGYTKPEAEQVMGRLEQHPWSLTHRPFALEEDHSRRAWNIDAPQYRYQPLEGPHPSWDLIFSHIGHSLDSHIPSTLGTIRTGADYLRAIFASILREPFEPTPYLFLFGPENSGKSTLHEAFELLVTRGVVKADRALTSQSDFNGELAGAILCVVEEKDIATCPGAYAKIKDAVTARQLSIRKMRTDSYMVANSTHWFQSANTSAACPIFPGQTRIQPIRVDAIESDIPKSQLMARLAAEGPAIMFTLLSMELPKAGGRLALPIIDTPEARNLADRNVDTRVQTIIDLVTKKDWIGTTAELAETVEGLPRDVRTFRRFASENEFLLLTAGVTIEEIQRAPGDKHPRKIRITAKR
jgi:hypothetical protein